MLNRITKKCEYHGDVEFVLEKNGRYRCIKCRSYQVQKRRDKIKQMAVEYKGGKCERCEYNNCLSAMDFHHLDPNEKDFGLAKNRLTRSWEAVKAELDKCILVCCRCHRELHDEQRSVAKEIKHKKELVSAPKEKKLKEITSNECPTCGKLKNSEQITCSTKCARIKNRKVNWDEINLEELYKENSMVAIGKMFGVSDNSVRKQLKKLGLL